MNIKITKNIEEANLVTHTGSFHPDDVFATAFLSRIIKNPVLIRTANPNNANKNAIVYDIGYGKFDHHGLDARYRTTPYEKIKYCSFGLLWEEYGINYLKQLFNEDIDHEQLYKNIEEKLILQMDAIDNGYFPKIESEYPLTDLDKVIDLFNKTWIEEVDNDDNFLLAVNIANQILDRVLKREYGLIIAAKKLEPLFDTVNNNILFLNEYIPYLDAIFNSKHPKASEIKIVIFPSNRGGYNIKPMTINKKSKELVVNFPKKLWGLHDENLEQTSNIKGARFIHLTGFMAATETKESALELANLALNNQEKIN